ncbi:hypothetical protein H0A36_09710 [Endozoicomonas sp. SM1973]|uniref:Uncharacterized protein n=1 Tax=Spartinivicinus marinus TaxID=2994442 RepID=A0A853I9Q8_9GAMM|nr:calcium-binding protein [Spartinivicinus marinus]NYZ66287.1 hypothetical protein [Spartinivicinus marinus]
MKSTSDAASLLRYDSIQSKTASEIIYLYKIPPKDPKSTPWVYHHVRCDAKDETYTTEQAAILGGMRKYYNGCGDPSIENKGQWGTLNNKTSGSCGSTNTYPKYYKGLEYINTRGVTVKYCKHINGGVSDGFTVYREREVFDCPENYKPSPLGVKCVYKDNIVATISEKCEPHENCTPPETEETPEECEEGFELVNGECVPKCPEGYVRNEKGECVLIIEIIKDNGPGDPCDKNHPNTRPSVGEPIRISTGNMFHQNVDITGRLPLIRTYNSSTGEWTHNYQTYLTINNQLILLKDGDGKGFQFKLKNSEWVSDPDVFHKLEETTEYNAAWKVTFSNNVIAWFDFKGKIIKKRVLGGVELDFIREGANLTINDTKSNYKLNMIVGEYDRVLQASIDPNERVVYQYSDQGQLLFVTYPNSKTRQFNYEDSRFPRYLTSLIDENGVVAINWKYDNQGRAISSERANSKEKYTLTYGDDFTTVVNPLGKVTTYYFKKIHGIKYLTEVTGHASENCAAANQSYEYYSNALLKAKTDWNGVRTTYQYNQRGLEVSRTEASGTSDSYTVYTEWHPFFAKPTKIAEPGKETTLEYSEAGQLINLIENDTTSVFYRGGNANGFSEEVIEDPSDKETSVVIPEIEVKGSESSDYLNGTNKSEYLTGLIGNDTLLAGEGNDVLEGGKGNDSLDGGAGNDIYLFGRGDGQDRINNYDPRQGSLDKLRFKSGVSPQDVRLRRNANQLIAEIIGTSDSVIINNFFHNGYNLDAIEFDDGTKWLLTKIRQLVQRPSDDKDEIHGYESDDELHGGAGHDVISGHQGADRLFGDAGHDRLLGDDGDDVLFGGEGNDNLSGGAGQDRLHGGEGSDTLTGYTGDDILDGGPGNDNSDGGAGNDIYLFGRGDGQDRITNYDPTPTHIDILRFKAGIAPKDIKLRRSGNLLIAEIMDTSDNVIVNYFFNTGYALDAIEFNDGTKWSLTKIRQLVQQPSDDKDEIHGYESDDELHGGAGHDVISGHQGADRLFGDAGHDRLLGDDGDDVLFGGEGNDNLSGGAGQDRLHGGEGSDTLTGYTGDDILDGGPGNDNSDGGAGNDIYLFGRGDGQDRITNYDPTPTHIDILRFKAGIAPKDIKLRRSGNLLIAEIMDTSDNVIVNYFFNTGYALDAIEFNDGTKWNLDTIKSKAQTN